MLCGHNGSSPLTRGKPHLVDLDHERQGLIPAHAGKTFCVGTGRPVVWAHPRSRGENVYTRPYKHKQVGSSPLTRGKPSRR